MRMQKNTVPFTMVANEVLSNPHISLRAKGLYAYLFSKPEGWQFSSNRIIQECEESKPTILKLLRELEDNCLLQRKRQKSGRMEYVLTFATCAVDPGQQSLLGPESKEALVKNAPGGQILPISNTDSLSNTEKESKTEVQPFFHEAFRKTEGYRQWIHELATGDYLKPVQLHEVIMQEFIPYWTEKNPGGKKCRWQMQKVFDTHRRVLTWLKVYHEKKKDFKCKKTWHKAGDRCYCFSKPAANVEEPGVPIPQHIADGMRDLGRKMALRK